MKTKDSKKQNVETIKEKSSFVFYRSYFEAIETLSMKNRLIAFEAIAKYGLDREETTNLPPRVLAILTMAIPNIDANHKKYFRKMKTISQASQKDTSDVFEDESIEEVLLPKKEYKNNSTENEDDSFNDKGGEFEP